MDRATHGHQVPALSAEGEATSTFCIEAARKALEAAKLEATELDLILVATVSPDHMLPACALLVQQAIGATKAAAYDLNAACSGFLTALTTGEAFSPINNKGAGCSNRSIAVIRIDRAIAEQQIAAVDDTDVAVL